MANHGRMSMAGDRATETAGDADTRIKAAARAAGRSGTTTGSPRRRSGRSGRCWSRRAESRRVSACSMSPLAQGTRLSGPPWQAPKSWLPTSRPRTSRLAAARRRRKGSSWSGSKPTPRLFPLAPASSTLSRLRSGRSSPLTIKPSPTRCCACAGPGHGWNAQLHPRGPDLRLLRRARALHAPPPPGAQPPPMWGSEEHVRELFGDGLGSLEMTRSEYVERAESPRDYRELFKQRSGRSSRPTPASPTIPTARQRSTATSWTSRRAPTGARPGVRRSTRTSTCSCSHGRATGRLGRRLGLLLSHRCGRVPGQSRTPLWTSTGCAGLASCGVHSARAKQASAPDRLCALEGRPTRAHGLALARYCCHAASSRCSSAAVLVDAYHLYVHPVRRGAGKAALGVRQHPAQLRALARRAVCGRRPGLALRARSQRLSG